MAPRHIVEATSYLADRRHRDDLREVCIAKQDSRIFAVTVIRAGMFLAVWHFSLAPKPHDRPRVKTRSQARLPVHRYNPL